MYILLVAKGNTLLGLWMVTPLALQRLLLIGFRNATIGLALILS